MYRYYYDEQGRITKCITIPKDDRWDYFDTVKGDYVESETFLELDDHVIDLETKEFRHSPRVRETKPRSFQEQRQVAYGSASLQLGLLYDDIKAGVFGEEAKSGAWAQHIAGAKASVPKS